jgi:hypothetical protein
MEPFSYDRIALCFQHKNVWTKEFGLEFERTRQIMSLLKPPFFIVFYSRWCSLPQTSLLDLTETAEGKCVTVSKAECPVL